MATATLGAPPAGVDGYRVTSAFTFPGSRSNETSVVLRVGRVITFVRAAETGAPAGSGWALDGLLDPERATSLVAVAGLRRRRGHRQTAGVPADGP